MLSLLIATKKLFTSFSFILKKDDTKALFFLMATTLMSGTIFYSTVEKFSILDALYLSFMTLTTIGYGDLHPITTQFRRFPAENFDPGSRCHWTIWHGE